MENKTTSLPWQRKTILVNPRLQLLTLFYGAAAALLGCLFTVIITRAGDTDSGSLVTVLVLIINALFCFSCIFLLGLYFTHKVFGPIYRLHKEIKDLKGKSTYTAIRLRDGDEFKELIEDFNDLMAEKIK